MTELSDLIQSRVRLAAQEVAAGRSVNFYVDVSADDDMRFVAWYRGSIHVIFRGDPGPEFAAQCQAVRELFGKLCEISAKSKW